MNAIPVVFENGVFRPVEPVLLPEGTQADVLLVPERSKDRDHDEPTLADLLKFAGAANDLPAERAAQYDH
jgi:predicted DNA-binding antitoxin AbrB/MazE fold protein